MVVFEAPRNRLPEVGDAAIFGVLGEIIPDGLDPGLFDVLGSREVRFPDAQVDDVFPLGPHGIGFGRYLEGRGRADFVDGF